MTNFSPVDVVSTAADQVRALPELLTKLPGALADHINGLIKILPLLPGVRFAEMGNLPIVILALIPVLVVYGLGATMSWRLHGLYGDRQLRKITSGTISVVGEAFLLAFRLVFFFGVLLFALLDPYVPGAPVRVPSGNRDYAVCVQDSQGMGAIDDDSDLAAAMSNGSAGSATTGGGGAGSGAGTATTSATTQATANGASTGDWLFHEKHSRLDNVRETIRRLMNTSLARSRVAIIAFQGEANVIVPMSDSPDWVFEQLDPGNKFGLRVGTSSLVGKGKVNGKVSTMAACLQAARKVLDENGAKNHEKFIIYFGNGDDISSPSWLKSEIAGVKEENIHGAIFGVGGKPTRIPTYSGDNELFAGWYRLRGAKEDALTGYNEENLQNLAAATGWPYKHLDPKHMDEQDLLGEDLSDYRMEIGRLHLSGYVVEIALLVYVGLALFGRLRRRVKGGS